MLKYLPLLILLSCEPDRDIPKLSDSETQTHSEFIKLDESHQAVIADKNEPGDRLALCLRFVDKSTKNPIANRPVYFYHADINGEYQPTDSSDESTARLNGKATTNADGKIFLQTTLPGDYGSSADNRHIHSTVFGAKPEAYDIHFSQYTGLMGRNFAEGSDQHFLAELKKDANDNLVAFLTIEVKMP